MADESIRNDFLDGVQEIFSTLFNEGKAEEGILLYPFVEEEDNIYKEHKFKKYKKPITLVSSVSVPEKDGNVDIKAQKRQAIFKVPTKCLSGYGYEMTKSNMAYLRKALIRFKDIFFTIDLIQSRIYVEDTFLLWEFQCTEIFDPDSIKIGAEDSEEVEIIAKESEE